MTKRDFKIALFGALMAFGVVAGTDGNYMFTAVFWVAGNLCLWSARERKGVQA